MKKLKKKDWKIIKQNVLKHFLTESTPKRAYEKIAKYDINYSKLTKK